MAMKIASIAFNLMDKFENSQNRNQSGGFAQHLSKNLKNLMALESLEFRSKFTSIETRAIDFG